MIQWMDNLLHIALSISALANCYSISNMLKNNRENRYLLAMLDARLTALEMGNKRFVITRSSYSSGIQGMAEDTKVSE